ncbi:MAG: extracellular solute-binding protein [Deltaproteobacteria bacterium]|nr:extracellular solute-binding protein [Deltaproteobacteria bacterium]
MPEPSRNVNRRDFIKSGTVALSGCTVAAPVLVSGCSFRTPAANVVRLGVTGYSAEPYRRVLKDFDFAGKTGLEVQVIVRPTTTNEILTQMTGAIQAQTSPYDVLDMEDSVAVSLSRAGWLLPLDDIITPQIWADFTKPLLEMTKVWDQHEGETFRVHHNFEVCYWWYRKDWFAEKGIDVPRTWDDVKAMGKIFTDSEKGIWATEEGMQKNAYLDVYMAWITRQAGGDLYEVDDSFRVALEYVHDLMYKDKVLNPACLQKNYDQQNNNYIADRVAFMRQWPFFYDVSQKYSSWYSPEKVACALPPVGPGGKSLSTYAAGWGYGIPKTAPNADGARELIRFLVSNKNAAKMVDYSAWFLNARHSVLKAAGQTELAKYLKMYMDAGVITTRPFHRKYTEAVAILENVTSAFLTKQLTLDAALSKAKDQMSRL